MCACASRDHRWLSTGDQGPDSAVIVWDARSRTPVRCFFAIHHGGVVALRLSPDVRYLATLSADSGHQILAVWDWTSSVEQPLCYTQLETGKLGVQAHVVFRSDDYFQVMSNSETHVVFYDWVRLPLLLPFCFKCMCTNLKFNLGFFQKPNTIVTNSIFDKVCSSVSFGCLIS